jgi:hypothetical protein
MSKLSRAQASRWRDATSSPSEYWPYAANTAEQPPTPSEMAYDIGVVLASVLSLALIAELCLRAGA